MVYKLLLTNQDGIKIYAKVEDDGIYRITCSEHDVDFLAWVADGNTPEPTETTE